MLRPYAHHDRVIGPRAALRQRHRPGQPGRPGRLVAWVHRWGPLLIRLAGVAAVCVVLVVCVSADAAAKDPSKTDLDKLNTVIGHIRLWVVGILAALATLFLTIGGVRYLSAGGDPGEVERAKTALKSAAIGYGLAALAPLALSILQHIVSTK